MNKLAFIGFALMGVAACTQHAHADRAYDVCSNNVQLHEDQLECNASAIARTNKSLNDSWKALSPSVRKNLLVSERAWIAQTNKSCDRYLNENSYGEMGQDMFTGCQVDAAEKRNKYLSNFRNK